jgi:hypothetical protein
VVKVSIPTTVDLVILTDQEMQENQKLINGLKQKIAELENDLHTTRTFRISKSEELKTLLGDKYRQFFIKSLKI